MKFWYLMGGLLALFAAGLIAAMVAMSWPVS